MKHLIATFFKLFILMIIANAILFAVYYIFNLQFNISFAIKITLIAGLSIALTIILIHYFFVNNITDKKVKERTYGVYQQKEISSHLNIIDIIFKLKEAPYFNKMKLKEKEDEIILRANITIYSYGELISIKHISKEYNINNYLVSSRPLIGFTMIDYGKNLKNIQQIDKLIKS